MYATATVLECMPLIDCAITRCCMMQVALPLLILNGIGVGVDFYNDSNLWNYISAFLVLRAFALLVSIGWVFLQVKEGRYIGQIAVNWLALSWISTVILGIPIAQAVFDDKAKGRFYGLLAGISSFIFQLPFQLLFLECHSMETDYIASRGSVSRVPSDQEEGHFITESEQALSLPASVPSNKVSPGDNASSDTKEEDGNDEVPAFLWLEFAKRGDVWRRILTRVVCNPVLVGIGMGFVLSLSTLGPRFLNPTSDEFVPGLAWFSQTCGWIGAMVSPLSLFTMGVWMQDEGRQLFQIPLLSAVLYMLSKLFVVPLIMVGLAKALNLNDEAGRAAVLIAALPISMASFSLASHYKIGLAILSANVALGTALMLPTILLWNIVMDKLELFPVPE